MKMNKIVGLSLAMMLGFSVVGCSSNNNNVDLESVIVPQVEEQENNNNFDKYNILSFGEIEIDTTKDYDGDVYNDIKFKVTNNSDKTVHTITVDIAFYDEEGVMLGATYPQEISSTPSGSSLYLDSLYDTTEYNVKEMKIVGYSYYIGENYYTVDLVGQFVEMYEVLN